MRYASCASLIVIVHTAHLLSCGAILNIALAMIASPRACTAACMLTSRALSSLHTTATVSWLAARVHAMRLAAGTVGPTELTSVLAAARVRRLNGSAMGGRTPSKTLLDAMSKTRDGLA